MKRATAHVLWSLVALSMTGCPIYPSDNLCHSNADCAPQYSCDLITGTCAPASTACIRPADCANPNETCNSQGVCQVGSCHQVGCVAGFGCVIFDSVWTCVPGTVLTGTGGFAGLGGSTSSGGTSAIGGSIGEGGMTPASGGLPQELGGTPANGGDSSGGSS